jgi:hypothetical protein
MAKKLHTKLQLRAKLIPKLRPYFVTISRQHFTLQCRGQSFSHCKKLQNTNFQSYKFNTLQRNKEIHSILHLPWYCCGILGSNFRLANPLCMQIWICPKIQASQNWRHWHSPVHLCPHPKLEKTHVTSQVSLVSD